MALPGWVETALELMTLGTVDIGRPGSPAVRVGPVTFGGRPGDSARAHPLVHEHKHRRRRRRALTASDRGDIAFIAGLLGPKAGKDFAVIIGAKN